MTHSRGQPAGHPAHARDRGRSSAGSSRFVADAARRPNSGVEVASARPAPASLRSDDRFTRLFDSNVVGIIVCDVHGGITEANDAFLTMLGHERDDLPIRWDRMTPPEYSALDAAKVEEIMATGIGNAWEKEYVAKDGRRVAVLVAVTLLDAARGTCVAIVYDISQSRRAERRISEQKDALSALAAKLVLAEERERRRIAIGLHDEIGQTLALAKLKLGRIAAAAAPGAADRPIGDLDGLLNRAITAIRSLTFELGSPVLYELGFEAALLSIGEETERERGIRFQLQVDPQLEAVPMNLAVMLYRIVRELVDNGATHGQARSVTVSVETREDQLRITVEDDGVGFDATGAAEGFGPTGAFGLFSIHAQLRHIGGRLEIDSAPGQGTRAVVVAPSGALEGDAA